MQTFQLPTWRCQCGYSQDFEPTQENADTHFNNPSNFPLSGLGGGECPSCALKGQRSIMAKESDPARKIQVSVLEDADIEAMNNTPEEKLALKAEARMNRTSLTEVVAAEVVAEDIILNP